jgi:hypothetical protein
MTCEAENAKRLAIVYMAVSFSLFNVDIEGGEIDHGLIDRDLVCEGDGIEFAGTDDERFHERLLVLTG